MEREQLKTPKIHIYDIEILNIKNKFLANLICLPLQMGTHFKSQSLNVKEEREARAQLSP